MKQQKFFYYSIVLFLTINLFSACRDIEIPGGSLSAYDQVYMPSAAAARSQVTIQLKDSVQSIVFGADFGGFGSPAKAITIDFSVAVDSVSSYNYVHGTAYPVLPGEAYVLDKTTATIAKGALSTEPLHISINPFGKLDSNKTYLLPVTISKVTEGFVINPTLKTTYYLITAK